MKRLCALVLAGFLCQPSRRPSCQDETPAVVVWGHSLNRVLDQGKTLFDQLGLTDIARSFDGLVKAKAGPKGLAGIDAAKPIGGFVRFDPDPSFALIVPIGTERDFLDLLERMELKAKRENDGTYLVGANLLFPVYAKITGSHAWITLVNKNAFAAKIDPTKLFPQGPALASARVRIDLLPKDARQLAISHFEDSLQQAMKKNPPADTPGQKAFTEACNQTLARMFAQTLEEGKELSLDLHFDAADKGVRVDLNLLPKAGTPLEKSLAAANKLTSVFGAATQESLPLASRLNIGLPDAVAKAFAQLFEEAYQDGTANLRDPGKKKQAQELYDAIKPSVQAGEIDGLLQVVGPDAEQKMGVVFGIKVKDGDKLGDIFRTLAQEAKKQMPEVEQAKVLLDADAVGATKIHRFVLAADKGNLQKAHDVLGDATLTVAFRPDAVLVGIGAGSQAAIKKLAVPAAASSPVLGQATIDVVRMGPLLGVSPKVRAIGEQIVTEKGYGPIVLQVSGGDRLAASISLRTPALRFLGAMRAEAGEPK